MSDSGFYLIDMIQIKDIFSESNEFRMLRRFHLMK